MKKINEGRINRISNDERAEQDIIFDPEDNLFCIHEGQSPEICHPKEYKSQNCSKKREKNRNNQN